MSDPSSEALAQPAPSLENPLPSPSAGTEGGSLRSRKKARQRYDLLRVAEDLFRERGFELTRMEDIASCCEVATKTVYNYFSNKRSILIALLDEDRQRFDTAYQEVVVNPSRDPAETLARLIRADIGDVRTAEDKKLWRELLAASMQSHEHGEDEFEANRRMFTRHIRRILVHYQECGEISEDVNLNIAVDLIYAIHAYDFRLYCASAQMRPAAVLELARKQMQLLVANWRGDRGERSQPTPPDPRLQRGPRR
jgi:AcrR family transcriptional regulator